MDLTVQTGAWSASGIKVVQIGDPEGEGDPEGGGEQLRLGFAAISFIVPLSATLDEEHVHVVGLNELMDGCEAGTVANPKAEPGHLCVYLGRPPIGFSGEVTEGTVINPATGGVGAAKAGARVVLDGDLFAMNGTWAMRPE